jgi:hypothetical protein
MRDNSMRTIFTSLREWFVRITLSLFFKKYFVFDIVKLEVKIFDANGHILDIGFRNQSISAIIPPPELR